MDPLMRKLFQPREAREKLRGMGGIMSSSPQLASTVAKFDVGGPIRATELQTPVGRSTNIGGQTYTLLPSGIVVNARTGEPVTAPEALAVHRKLQVFPETDPIQVGSGVNPSFAYDERMRGFGIGTVPSRLPAYGADSFMDAFVPGTDAPVAPEARNIGGLRPAPVSETLPATPMSYEQILAAARAGQMPTYDTLAASAELLNDQQAADVNAMIDSGYIPDADEQRVSSMPGVTRPEPSAEAPFEPGGFFDMLARSTGAARQTPNEMDDMVSGAVSSVKSAVPRPDANHEFFQPGGALSDLGQIGARTVSVAQNMLPATAAAVNTVINPVVRYASGYEFPVPDFNLSGTPNAPTGGPSAEAIASAEEAAALRDELGITESLRTLEDQREAAEAARQTVTRTPVADVEPPVAETAAETPPAPTIDVDLNDPSTYDTDFEEMMRRLGGATGKDDKSSRQKAMADLAMIGLAIAAGQSPDALTNIAQGALTGMKAIRAEDAAKDAAASETRAFAAKLATDREIARMRGSATTGAEGARQEYLYNATFNAAFQALLAEIDPNDPGAIEGISERARQVAANAAPSAPSARGAAATTTALPEVATQEQFDALPAGAEFTQNGQRRRKPAE